MSLPVWPTELDFILREGWQRQLGDGRRSLPGEQGVSRTRRFTSKASDVVTLVLILTDDEDARLDRFYYEEVDRGAGLFLIPDFARDGRPILGQDLEPLTDESGAPLLIAATLVCKFGNGLPSRTAVGADWRVQFNLEVLP
ncbi:hypothetical protein [Pelagibacterium halotolerans]|uniref:Uncharacterized protein n=1 Tax=Pelagibacterium halotolerans (strain DSM 22347 / JCM 15775 / CGMCC 1.7692 / B2) TaxID=1082931 RepID=G4RDB9_PELHB|nr:hypothetical protein [Pelagibacterium halotolerans]AEQ50745.1 hypothetical protein KKY_706 [Pelagibacterium halotolerans B2]QJR19334.1 hypothetical protein HKM20_13330 [Pelagibacterium halotolerans]SDZ94678.1 hypothetical protein SAMN05428936_101632 [Pelagibacterium halotolerans]